jgi:4-amino-4-deoxy-L-arabinose transferase-like glycosyltransferase
MQRSASRIRDDKPVDLRHSLRKQSKSGKLRMSRRPDIISPPKDHDRNAAPAAFRFWGVVALILAAGLAFRLPGLATRSLWIDELFSEWFASQSFSDLWRDVPTYETHPPFYYTLLKLWTSVFGNSELGLRSLSLLASMATILIVAASGRLVKAKWLTDGVSLLAALLLAVNYASIRDAQNARPYALQTFLCTAAVLAALALVARLRPRTGESSRPDGWIAPALLLGASAGLALWIHNTSLFIAFGIWCGLALSLAVTPAGERLRNFAIFSATGVLALLVWAPYIPIFIAQSRAFSGLAFWLTPKIRDLYSAWMLILGDAWPALSLGLALLALGLFRLSRHRPALAIMVAAILLVPLYGVLAVSFAVKPIYIQRLFAWMVPLALLVIAFGVLTATRRRWPRLVLALAAMSFAAIRSFMDINRPIDDWKAIVAEIAENARPGDVVIAVPAEGSIAVDYYARRQANFPPIVCVPGCYPQRGLPRTYMSNFGAPRLIEADGETVDRALASHGRVWLVQVSVTLYDPKSIVRSRIAAARTFVRYYGNSLAKVELFE